MDAPAPTPSRLPFAYFAFAWLCAGAAFALLATEPGLVAGFYHPRLIGVVHLVTLGWITGSILGALHVVFPLALSTPFPVTRADRWLLFPLFTFGVAGLVSHFWIFEFRGMAWSGGMVAVVLAAYGWRVLCAVRRAKLPRPVAWLIRLAFLNLGAAVALGLDLAVQRATGDLSSRLLQQVAAHAHVAAVGFATLLVAGLGWRLLPMVLPSRVPPVVFPLVTAVAIESGLVLLVSSLIWQIGSSLLAAALIALGLGSFVASAIWMARHRLRAPASRPKGDPAPIVAGSAIACLAVATAIGMTLSVTSWPPPAPLAIAYGIAALPGFLGLLIIGIQIRLVPMHVWLVAAAGRRTPPDWSAHDRVDPVLAHLTWLLWMAGLLLLGSGATWSSLPVTAVGGCLGAAGALAGLTHPYVLTRTPSPECYSLTGSPSSPPFLRRGRMS